MGGGVITRISSAAAEAKCGGNSRPFLVREQGTGTGRLTGRCPGAQLDWVRPEPRGGARYEAQNDPDFDRGRGVQNSPGGVVMQGPRPAAIDLWGKWLVRWAACAEAACLTAARTRSALTPDRLGWTRIGPSPDPRLSRGVPDCSEGRPCHAGMAPGCGRGAQLASLAATVCQPMKSPADACGRVRGGPERDWGAGQGTGKE